MTLTQEFLNTGTLADLESKYSIKVKRHGEFPNLVMLKYDQINSPMSEPIVQECRGLILDEADSWRVVSFPFRKFFNYGEPNAAEIDWSSARVYEKLDGSLMTLYRYRHEWRVASNGTPDAGGKVEANSFTFADLFWRTFKELKYTLPDHRFYDSCFMFEMMTPYNRIVVPHEKNRLILIGARDVVTGEEDAPTVAIEFGWEHVRSFPLTSINEVVESASILTGLDGEGYVVCDDQFNRIKVKCPQYVALAHMKETMTARRMLDVVRANESDEFLSYFPEMRPMYQRVKDHFECVCTELEAAYAEIATIPVQKDFALRALQSRCSAALFAVRNKKAENIRHYFATAPAPAVERAILDGMNLEEGRMPSPTPSPSTQGSRE